MRKVLAIGTTAVVLTTFTAVGAAAQAAQSDDMVAGSTKVMGNNGAYQQVSVSGRSGPAGEDPRGHAVYRTNALQNDAKGRVVCLSVNGDFAEVGVLLEEPVNGNEFMAILVHDGGNPSSGRPDGAFVGFSQTQPTYPGCSEGAVLFQIAGDRSGNLVVSDSTD